MTFIMGRTTTLVLCASFSKLNFYFQSMLAQLISSWFHKIFVIRVTVIPVLGWETEIEKMIAREV